MTRRHLSISRPIIYGIACLAVLGFLCAVVFLQTSKERTSPGYEKVAFHLLEALKAGQYGEVETFFQDSHKNKRLTTAGREYMDSVFMRWYDNDYYLTPALLESINGWIKAYPQSPFALLARAQYNYQLGWKARGGGWAYKVSPQAWQAYHTKLQEAYSDVATVLKQDVTIPTAYNLAVMILAQADDEASRQSARQLVEQAKQQQLSDLHGIQRNYILYTLSPYWGGDAQQMLAYARGEAKDASKQSLAPELVAFVHSHLTIGLSHAQKKSYYAQPGVWEEVQSAYEHVLAAYPRGAVWLLNYGLAAYDAGYYEKSGELFNRASDADPDYSRIYYYAGKTYMTPTSYPMAEKSFRRYAQMRPEDDEPYRYLAFIKIKQEQYQEAIELADKGIALNAGRCGLWAYRCQAHGKISQWPEALSDCNHAIAVDSQCKIGYRNRSEIYKAMGDNDKSAQDLAIYNGLKEQEN